MIRSNTVFFVKQDEAGGQNAQGDSRAGEQTGGAGESQTGGGGTERDEVAGDC